jgi:hypothetical protein
LSGLDRRIRPGVPSISAETPLDRLGGFGKSSRWLRECPSKKSLKASNWLENQDISEKLWQKWSGGLEKIGPPFYFYRVQRLRKKYPESIRHFQIASRP